MIPHRLTALISCLFTASAAAAEPASLPSPTNLRAAAAKIDITPPPGTPVVGHVREVSGVRDPLHAALLLLDDSQTRAAILTLDLINAPREMTRQLREAIAAAADVPPENIMVATSHNHSGPGWAQNEAWNRQATKNIAAAAKQAAGKMRPVSIGYETDTIDFNINRRQMIGGRSVVRLNPDGPCDHRVKVLRFDDGQSLEPLAVVIHAVCHPCVFTWGDKWSQPHPGGYPKMSADFPGEAKSFVEQAYGGRTTALFLQGCAGDIRPNLPGYPYRCGDEADIRWTGRSLGCAAVRAADKTAIREEVAKRPAVFPIRCATTQITLPAASRALKKGTGSEPNIANPSEDESSRGARPLFQPARQGGQATGNTVDCELQAMKIGPFLLLTMPGEPMVEYGLRLEREIGPRAIPIVVGYANGHIGYICTKQAFAEGGYEPNHSHSGDAAEEILISELLKLTDRVIGDVFESFAPTRR